MNRWQIKRLSEAVKFDMNLNTKQKIGSSNISKRESCTNQPICTFLWQNPIKFSRLDLDLGFLFSGLSKDKKKITVILALEAFRIWPIF